MMVGFKQNMKVVDCATHWQARRLAAPRWENMSVVRTLHMRHLQMCLAHSLTYYPVTAMHLFPPSNVSLSQSTSMHHEQLPITSQWMRKWLALFNSLYLPALFSSKPHFLNATLSHIDLKKLEISWTCSHSLYSPLYFLPILSFFFFHFGNDYYTLTGVLFLCVER